MGMGLQLDFSGRLGAGDRGMTHSARTEQQLVGHDQTVELLSHAKRAKRSPDCPRMSHVSFGVSGQTNSTNQHEPMIFNAKYASLYV